MLNLRRFGLNELAYQIGKWFDSVTHHSWFLPHLVGWRVLISNPDCIRTKAERRKNVRVSHHDFSCSQAFSLPFISHPVLSWAEHDPAMDCQLSLIRGSLSLIWGLCRKNRDGRRQRENVKKWAAVMSLQRSGTFLRCITDRSGLCFREDNNSLIWIRREITCYIH